MKKFLAYFLVSTLSAAVAHAGGSLSREEALHVVCAQDKALCVVLSSFQLDPAGSAVRLPSGQRVMPFEFLSTINGKRIAIVIDQANSKHLTLSLTSAESPAFTISE